MLPPPPARRSPRKRAPRAGARSPRDRGRTAGSACAPWAAESTAPGPRSQPANRGSVLAMEFLHRRPARPAGRTWESPERGTMKREQRVLENFFGCLKAHDSGGLLRCYDPEIEHTDWVFVQLRGRRVVAKWTMLFERVPALDVHVHVLHVSGNQGLAAWELRYPG